MEKLLRDLNIYAHSFMNCNLTFTHDGNRIRVQGDEIGPYIAESIILNKKFGFIKWLVENDKIDRTFRENVRYPYYLEKEGLLQGYEKSDVIIMLLSISSSPIDDLISYLK